MVWLAQPALKLPLFQQIDPEGFHDEKRIEGR
jgi:hypothetical protein